MSRDTLGEFGPERHVMKNTGSGGKQTMKDVNDYQAPKGPRNINDPKSPSLHGVNWDYCGTQGATSGPTQSSGSPGLGGETDCCVQGRH